jgi:hypothetical protein
MPIVNWLVVAGEIGIGALLILGLFTRFAAVAGALMMGLFFVATWDFSHGVINEQLMYGIVTAVLGVVAAGRYYGFDAVLGEGRDDPPGTPAAVRDGMTGDPGRRLSRPDRTSDSGPSGPLSSFHAWEGEDGPDRDVTCGPRSR